MKAVASTTLLSLVLLSSAPGCYFASQGRDLETRVAAVEQLQDDFRATFDEERARLTELALRAEEKIDELEVALNQAQTFLQRTNADLGVRVDGLESQLNELRGSLEEGAFQAAQLRQELELLRQDIEIQLSNLDGR